MVVAIIGIAATAGAAATAAAGAGSTTLGSVGTAAAASNPVGWLILGAEENKSEGEYTFDCWKPVLHDHSARPSKGVLLRDIFTDPRIKDVEIKTDIPSGLPNITLHNVWNEKYRVDFVYIYSDQLAAHAVKIE